MDLRRVFAAANWNLNMGFGHLLTVDNDCDDDHWGNTLLYVFVGGLIGC